MYLHLFVILHWQSTHISQVGKVREVHFLFISCAFRISQMNPNIIQNTCLLRLAIGREVSISG